MQTQTTRQRNGKRLNRMAAQKASHPLHRLHSLAGNRAVTGMILALQRESKPEKKEEAEVTYIPIGAWLKQAITHTRAGKRTKAREVLGGTIQQLWNKVIPAYDKIDPALARKLDVEAQLFRGWGRELKPESPKKIAGMMETELSYVDDLEKEMLFGSRK